MWSNWHFSVRVPVPWSSCEVCHAPSDCPLLNCVWCVPVLYSVMCYALAVCSMCSSSMLHGVSSRWGVIFVGWWGGKGLVDRYTRVPQNHKLRRRNCWHGRKDASERTTEGESSWKMGARLGIVIITDMWDNQLDCYHFPFLISALTSACHQSLSQLGISVESGKVQGNLRGAHSQESASLKRYSCCNGSSHQTAMEYRRFIQSIALYFILYDFGTLYR